MTQELEDYHRGEKDCIAGKDHKEGESSDYDAGYSHQYSIEQWRTARSEGANNEHKRP